MNKQVKQLDQKAFDVEKFYNKFKSDLMKTFNISEDNAKEQAEMVKNHFQEAFLK